MNGHGEGIREPYAILEDWLAGQSSSTLKRKQQEADSFFRRLGIKIASIGRRF